MVDLVQLNWGGEGLLVRAECQSGLALGDGGQGGARQLLLRGRSTAAHFCRRRDMLRTWTALS